VNLLPSRDLAAQVWSASAQFTATGDNGVVVNCPAGPRGFDAVGNHCDPMDDNAHGTHVSGIIGAVGNNGVGVAGVNWNVTILPCKFLDANGVGYSSNAIGCLNLIRSLKDSGVNIVATNNGWGGSDYSQSLHDAIAAQLADGIVPISHSLRRTRSTASADPLRRFFSSRLGIPQSALKCGIIRGARNIALPRANLP